MWKQNQTNQSSNIEAVGCASQIPNRIRIEKKPAIQMSFSQLPVELLEMIFLNLDGVSFCLVQTVCKSWYKVLKKMQEDKTLWQMFCCKEIPNVVIEEMLSYKSISLQNLIIEWKSMYKKWHLGKLTKRKNVGIDTIVAFYSNPVTCMKASGSWIITGHSNGYLNVWNQVNGELTQTYRCHLRIITDLALVDLQNLGSYYGFETLPWSHHHIITVSKDTCIKIKGLLEPLHDSESDIILNKHGDGLMSIKLFENQFAVHCQDNTITLWSLKLKKQPYVHLEVLLLRTIIGPADIIRSLGFWHDEIYCTSHSGSLKVYCPRNNEWLEQKYFKESLSTVRDRITAYHLYRNKVILVCTAGGKLIVSVDEKNNKAYNLMMTLRTLIVSVALHGSTLALGGENGRVYLYHVSKSESLLDLDLIHPIFHYTLSEASILRLDIQYNCDIPLIFTSTTECLFIIKWFKKEVKLDRTDFEHHFGKRIIVP